MCPAREGPEAVPSEPIGTQHTLGAQGSVLSACLGAGATDASTEVQPWWGRQAWAQTGSPCMHPLQHRAVM